MSTIDVEDQTETGNDVRQLCCRGCGQVVAVIIPPGSTFYVRHPTPSCAWVTSRDASGWLRQVFGAPRNARPN